LITVEAQPSERDALIALYNSTDGANWTDNTSWLGAVGTECSSSQSIQLESSRK